MKQVNSDFFFYYVNEWDNAVEKIKKSSKDLSEIKLVCREGMYEQRTSKRNSNTNH